MDMPLGYTDIFLHAGLMKTGSTSVQTSLAAAADPLRSHGIDFPLFPDAASHGGAHGMALRHLIGYRTDAPFGHSENHHNVEAAKHVFQQLQTSSQRKLLLSDELLPSLPETYLRRLAEKLRSWAHPEVRFHLLIVVRHPLDWMNSARNEFLRNGFTEQDMYRPDGIMNPILKNDWMQETCRKFVRTGLCDHLTISRFEDVSDNNNLLTTISRWANIPLVLPGLRENKSLAWEFLTLLESARTAPGFPDHDWIQSLGPIRGTKSQPTSAEATRWQGRLLNGMNRFCDTNKMDRYEERQGALDWGREDVWSEALLSEFSAILATSPIETKRFVQRRLRALRQSPQLAPAVQRRLKQFGTAQTIRRFKTFRF